MNTAAIRSEWFTVFFEVLLFDVYFARATSSNFSMVGNKCSYIFKNIFWFLGGKYLKMRFCFARVRFQSWRFRNSVNVESFVCRVKRKRCVELLWFTLRIQHFLRCPKKKKRIIRGNLAKLEPFSKIWWYLVAWMEDARRICDTRMRRKPTQYDVASLFHKRKLFRARDFRKDFVA